jgi:predicted homoserine dehydrogenase-like protein
MSSGEKQHNDRGRTRVGVVGTGYISRVFVQTMETVDDVEVSRVLTRRRLDACDEYARPDLLTNAMGEVIESSDVVFECSGDPVHAFDVISAAVSAGLPVVTMNTEFHVTCGSHFAGRGLVTEAEGDQPGCTASLREQALEMGFRPLVYGNMKGFLNHTPTREEMEYWGAKQHISLPMVTAFTDGTKVQFEQALVANAFGATIAKQGLLGPQCDSLQEGANTLADQAQQLGQPISDYLLSSKLSHGVFIVATHNERQRDALAYYKLGDGPYYVLVRPNIFVHLEVLRSIRRVVREGRGLLDNSAWPTVSVVAVAKREMSAGSRIEHALGSFDVRGEAARISEVAGHVPIGLLANAVVRRRVEPGQVITFDDVDPMECGALNAWRAIEQRVLARPISEGAPGTALQGAPWVGTVR